MGQLVFAKVLVERCIIYPYEHGLLYGPSDTMYLPVHDGGQLWTGTHIYMASLMVLVMPSKHTEIMQIYTYVRLKIYQLISLEIMEF